MAKPLRGWLEKKGGGRRSVYISFISSHARGVAYSAVQHINVAILSFETVSLHGAAHFGSKLLTQHCLLQAGIGQTLR